MSFREYTIISKEDKIMDLQVFKNEEFGTIRIVEKDGKILFCGSDVAKALGYINTKAALARHCKEDGVAFHDLTDNLGRMQQVKFINEGLLHTVNSNRLRSLKVGYLMRYFRL